MKRILVLFVFVGVVSAQDAQDERLKLARVAIEAKLKVGDVLRQKGDLDGALKAYREAAALYDAIVSRDPAKAPGVVRAGGRPIRGGRAVTVAATRQSIARALKWLSGYQSRDGRWDCDGWMNKDPAGARGKGAGGARYDVGVTALSLIAFLRTGHGDKNNPYSDTVKRGLTFLMDQQGRDGCVGGRASQHFIYNTILATTALCDGYRVTRDDAYRAAAQRSVNFLLKARNPYLGWRYGVRSGENDTSVTALAVQALKAAKLAGLKVDANAFQGARQWMGKMTNREFGQVGYNFPGGSSARPEGLQDKFPPERTQAMTAAGILTRILLGEDPRTSALIQKGATLCAQLQPAWDQRGSIDMYFWYLGTRALFEVGGAHWRDWPTNLRNHLVAGQDKGGSWDPVGPWGHDGGRVYSTAICALSLHESLRPQKARIFAAPR